MSIGVVSGVGEVETAVGSDVGEIDEEWVAVVVVIVASGVDVATLSDSVVFAAALC